MADTGDLMKRDVAAIRLVHIVYLMAACEFARTAKYPDRPLRLISHFPPGDSLDLVH